MILKIFTHPDPILNEKTKLIELDEINNPKFQKFVDDMLETMYVEDGVGLAAPQVGKSIKMCVISKEYSLDHKDLVLINPVWEKLSRFQVWDSEGCLSVPNVYGKVKRYRRIKIQALNRHGEKINFEADNFFARIIQHECDHLDGVLFIEKAKNLQEVSREL